MLAPPTELFVHENEQFFFSLRDDVSIDISTLTSLT